jgi:hypothetical protein
MAVTVTPVQRSTLRDLLPQIELGRRAVKALGRENTASPFATTAVISLRVRAAQRRAAGRFRESA